MYLRDLYQQLWDNCTAPTQYQTTGSSHELASLLVTEVVQYSIHVSDRPVFLLVLDAQSAFDRCLRQILCCELFKAGLNGDALILINNRLSNRSTVYQWEGEMLGPAQDITGFEQGGINSGDYYKLYNNDQLLSAQSSNLGVNIGSSTISAIGQADDVILAANDIDSLRLLATLTENYCQRYRVKLVPSKTKLLPIYAPRHRYLVKYAELVNPVTIGGVPVKFVTEAEHVGVIRSTCGNLPNILHRVASHKKALAAVTTAGMARSHRGNPAASLKVHQLYATSVLFSGLASLVLSSAEVKIIDGHFKKILQNLQRLHLNTPRSVVYFMAGSLPGEAVLHIKQLSLFSMICHLPTDPLHHHAKYVLSEAPLSAKSWFFQIRDLCLKYKLPPPAHLLQNPPAKKPFKKEVKLRVLDYWQHLLRAEIVKLTSLNYITPQYYSLSQPHPIWTTSASNPFECAKSTVLARMASGRYRTEALCRHWTSSNRQGFCTAPTCSQVLGDLEHLLIVCPALDNVRSRLQQMWLEKSVQFPQLHSFLRLIFDQTPSVQTQFIIEPMAFPSIVSLLQFHGQPLMNQLMYLTRTYAFYIHREKKRILGLWPENATKKKNANIKNQISSKTVQTNDFIFTGVPSADRALTVPSAALLSTHKRSNPHPTPTPHHIQSFPVPILTRSAPADCDGPATSSHKLLHHRPTCPTNVSGQECMGGVGSVRPAAHLQQSYSDQFPINVLSTVEWFREEVT